MKMGLMISSLFYLVTIITLMQNEGSSCNGCLENERIGLLEIKHYFVSQKGADPNNELGSSWVDDRDSNCCNWNRVKCSNISSGHITELSLRDLQYDTHQMRMMNVSLFRPFEELILLDLSFNNLEGWTHYEDVQSLKNLKFLSLSDNYMNGSVEGLCQLKNLQELDISNNMFSGQLPECLSNLTNLRVLDVGSNLFSGPFPSFTTNLTSLTYLSLYDNYMQGSFSLSTLANHSNLQVLYISSKSIGAHVETEKTKWFPKFQLKSLVLRNCNINIDERSVIPTFLSYQYHLLLMVLSRNKLVGSFPSWLVHNNNGIHYLDISHNNLNGLLPKDIGVFLPNVTNLDISWNSFEGNIPSSIGNMKELVSLDFSHNYFTGELPKQLTTDWNNLQFLMLSNNFLSGNIPKFSNSRNLESLFLDNNNFSGTIEDVLGNNTRLEMLCITNNSISGTIPSSIGMFSRMQSLLLGDNQLEGEIPIEISNMTSLQIMDLSQNKLIGSIPKFSKMKSLRFLYLGKNDLSGSIPFDLSGSSQLKLLDLTDNKFSGKIPNWMDMLAELRVLLLGGNKFEGDIPTQLCLFKKINIMDLSRNMLNSSIPSCFRNMPLGQYHDDSYGPIFETIVGNGYVIPYVFSSSLKRSFDRDLFLNDDDDMLHLEAEFRTKHMDYYYKGKVLENMTGLDLSCNNLTGSIPSQIGNLQKIITLNLSHNFLSGPIPITFSNLTQIESLDLSYNQLSGEIPSQLTQLNFLEIFNVSYNNLSGIPPSAGQFANFDEENYRANPGLCGPLLNRKCEGIASSSQSNDSGEKETKVDMISFYWSFRASYITILLAFIKVLCINARWRMAWFYYVSKVMRTCFPTFPLY